MGASADHAHADRTLDGCELVKRLLVRTLGHVGDHISELAFGAEGLRRDVDAILAQHPVDACQHTGQIGVQMGDAEVRLDVGQRDLRHSPTAWWIP